METVDAIVAELIIKGVDMYEGEMRRVIAVHDGLGASVKRLQANTFDIQAEGQKYKAAAGSMSQASEQADQKITRSRKARVQVAKAADEAEVVSAKKAATAKADVEIAEAARSARLRAAVEKGVARSSVTPGSGANIGRTVAREGLSGVAPATGAAVAGVGAAEAAVATEKELNQLAVDRAKLQANLPYLRGKEAAFAKELVGELRLINQLQAQGASEQEISLALSQRQALVEAQRARTARSNLLGGASKFAEGAGLRRTSGSGLAVAGIATAVAVGVGGAAIDQVTAYGKALDETSTRLGIATDKLQAYIKLARDAGVTQEQLTTAFDQFANVLGRAQQGDKDAAKIFAKGGLNIDISGFKSAGDALPTIINRLSQVKDESKRAAIETRLFGESGRRLDSLLSGGNDRINDLAKALIATGQALSQREIKELNETAKKLAEVKAQLTVDFAKIVAGNADAIERLAGAFGRLAGGILKFYDAHPQLAFTLAGAAIGGRIAGVPGAIVGAGGGFALSEAARSQDLSGLKKLSDSQLHEGQSKTLAALQRMRDNGATDNPIYKTFEKVADAAAAEIKARDAAGNPPSETAQTGKVGPLNKTFAPDGPKGKSADTLSREAAARQKRYLDENARLEDERLDALRAQSSDEDVRRDYDKKSIESAEARQVADYNQEVIEKQLTRERADQLIIAAHQTATEKLNVIALDEVLSAIRRDAALKEQIIDAQLVVEQVQLSIAQTAKDRKASEEKILSLTLQREKIEAQEVLDRAAQGDASVTKQDIKSAQETIASQPARRAASEADINFRNRGPLKQYLDQLPRSAAQVDEALENAAAHGLQSLNDGLTDAVSKFLHLHGIAGDFLKDLIQIGIQRELLIPLADTLFPTGDSSGGGILSSLSKLFGGTGGKSSGLVSGDNDTGLGALFKSIGATVAGTRASGGNVVGGQTYLVGEHGPEPVTFGASGHVYPNGALPTIGAHASGGRSEITLHVEAGEYFDARVGKVAGPIAASTSVRVVRAAAPGIAGAAVAAGPGRLTKLQTLGS